MSLEQAVLDAVLEDFERQEHPWLEDIAMPVDESTDYAQLLARYIAERKIADKVKRYLEA